MAACAPSPKSLRVQQLRLSEDLSDVSPLNSTNKVKTSPLEAAVTMTLNQNQINSSEVPKVNSTNSRDATNKYGTALLIHAPMIPENHKNINETKMRSSGLADLNQKNPTSTVPLHSTPGRTTYSNVTYITPETSSMMNTSRTFRDQTHYTTSMEPSSVTRHVSTVVGTKQNFPKSETRPATNQPPPSYSQRYDGHDFPTRSYVVDVKAHIGEPTIVGERWEKRVVKVPRKIYRQDFVEDETLSRVKADEVADCIHGLEKQSVGIPEIHHVDNIASESHVKKKPVFVSKPVHQNRVIECPVPKYETVPNTRDIPVPKYCEKFYVHQQEIPQFEDNYVDQLVKVDQPVDVEICHPLPFESRMTLNQEIHKVVGENNQIKEYNVYVPRIVEMPINRALLSKASATQVELERQRLLNSLTAGLRPEDLLRETQLLRAENRMHNVTTEIQAHGKENLIMNYDSIPRARKPQNINKLKHNERRMRHKRIHTNSHWFSWLSNLNFCGPQSHSPSEDNVVEVYSDDISTIEDVWRYIVKDAAKLTR